MNGPLSVCQSSFNKSALSAQVSANVQPATRARTAKSSAKAEDTASGALIAVTVLQETPKAATQ